MTISLPAIDDRNPMTQPHAWQGLIHAYRPYLPVTDATEIVTLHEGNTPLIPVPAIAREIGTQVEVFVK